MAAMTVAMAAAVRRSWLPPPARVGRLAGMERGHGRGRGHSHGRGRARASPGGRLSSRTRRLLGAGAVSLLAAVVAPPLVLAVPVGLWVGPRLKARQQARVARAQVEADLPEMVDLLRLGVGAGLTVTLAVAAVARRSAGPVGRGLAEAAVAVERGQRLADALDDLPRTLGEAVRPLASTLAASERYGHPIGPALERLAAECRADQRRRAEAAARRVPVLLLFPLVVCILPAFALLTVAPLVAGALRSLRL
jgi:tight adherence protein C